MPTIFYEKDCVGVSNDLIGISLFLMNNFFQGLSHRCTSCLFFLLQTTSGCREPGHGARHDWYQLVRSNGVRCPRRRPGTRLLCAHADRSSLAGMHLYPHSNHLSEFQGRRQICHAFAAPHPRLCAATGWDWREEGLNDAQLLHHLGTSHSAAPAFEGEGEEKKTFFSAENFIFF